MRVIQVVDSLNVGGAERVLITLCNILKTADVQIAVCLLTDNLGLLPYLDKRIPVHRLNRRFKWNPLKLYEVHRMCSAFDIVHVHLRYNLRYIGLAKFIFRGKYTMLLHDHFGDIEQVKSIPVGLSFFMQRSWYVGVHPALSRWAIEHVGLQSHRAFVLSNTILKNGKAISPQFTVDSEKSSFRFVKVANFRTSKNQVFAVQLMAAFVRKHPASLDLIGRINDSYYCNHIRQVIDEECLTKQITLNHEITDVQPMLHQYSLAIHTASLESGPLVLLEYLALGLPFLSYKTGQVADELQSDFPEFFMSTFHVHEWIDRIFEIFRMDVPALQKRMMHYFEQHYAPEVYGKKCQDIYNQMLKADRN